MTKKKQPFTVYSSYGWNSVSPGELTRKLQKAAVKIAELREADPEIDALAFTGSSGAAIAFVMSVDLQISLIHVRKKGDDSHGAEIEGTAWHRVRKYLIVDDFIDRGTTVERIYEKILHKAEKNGLQVPECAGIYLYEKSDRRSVYEIDKGVKVPVYG